MADRDRHRSKHRSASTRPSSYVQEQREVEPWGLSWRTCRLILLVLVGYFSYMNLAEVMLLKNSETFEGRRQAGGALASGMFAIMLMVKWWNRKHISKNILLFFLVFDVFGLVGFDSTFFRKEIIDLNG